MDVGKMLRDVIEIEGTIRLVVLSLLLTFKLVNFFHT
jgi:hypothetical protein